MSFCFFSCCVTLSSFASIYKSHDLSLSLSLSPMKTQLKPTHLVWSHRKWIESCGVRIILNSGNTGTTHPPPPLINGETLPDFVNRSKPHLLVDGNCLPNVNIYTEFGEISPQHIFHLFHNFINWPEYQHSSFVSLMQQHYMKMTERKDGDDRL